LEAMSSVVDPDPARLDELAGRNHRGVSDEGDQVALASCLDPQHAKTFSELWNYAVDQPCQDFGGGARSLCLRHAPIMKTDVRGHHSIMRRKLWLSATRPERPWKSQPLPHLTAATFPV